MVTLKDIAREAEVSIMTVSNVINGNHTKVSQGTMEKVNALIEKYNYVPNSAARSLSAKSSRIIALCFIGGSDFNLLDSPYNSKIAGVIEQIVKKQGYYLMLSSASDSRDILRKLTTWNVDGAIFLGIYDEYADDLRKNISFPAVYLDSYYENKDIISIRSDDYRGGYLAAKYLVHAGHSRIGFACSQDVFTNTQLMKRYEGFTAGLQESGLSTENMLHTGSIDYEGGIALGKKIAQEKRLTAVASTADIFSIGIMEGARLGGLTVPKDLSVVGFDDLPVCCYTTPKLTTIRQHIEKKGETATRLLLDQIENRKKKIEHVVLDVELVERGSVLTLG